MLIPVISAASLAALPSSITKSKELLELVRGVRSVRTSDFNGHIF